MVRWHLYRTRYIINMISNYVLRTLFLVVACTTVFLFVKFFWCPCMAINVSVQYNGVLLPDIILLTLCDYVHWGTRLNAVKRFCLCSL